MRQGRKNIFTKGMRTPIRVFALILLFLMVNDQVLAQQELLSVNLVEGRKKETFGQNLRHYAHLYGGLGFMAGPPQGKGAKIIYGISLNPEIGGRVKLRLNRQLAIGADLSYNLFSYKLRQGQDKLLPDTLPHNAERFLFGSLTLGLYTRVNLGRTGNFIGRFIDLGMYGEWLNFTDHYYKDKLDNGNIFRIHVSGLDYVNKLQYGIYARVGITRYAFVAKYRISNYFRKDSQLPDLPRFTFGIQVGVHKVN